MLIERPPDIPPSEITAPAVYRDRRRFLKMAGIAAGVAAAGYDNFYELGADKADSREPLVCLAVTLLLLLLRLTLFSRHPRRPRTLNRFSVLPGDAPSVRRER